MYVGLTWSLCTLFTGGALPWGSVCGSRFTYLCTVFHFSRIHARNGRNWRFTKRNFKSVFSQNNVSILHHEKTRRGGGRAVVIAFPCRTAKHEQKDYVQHTHRTAFRVISSRKRQHRYKYGPKGFDFQACTI